MIKHGVVPVRGTGYNIVLQIVLKRCLPFLIENRIFYIIYIYSYSASNVTFTRLLIFNILFLIDKSFETMEKSLVSVFINDLYITHAEYHGCFIKIWGNFYSKKRSSMEKYLQTLDYTDFTKVKIIIITYFNYLVICSKCFRN